MKKRAMRLLAFLILAAPAAAWAQKAGDVGAGFVLGSPVGVTGKYWLNGTNALDLGLGYAGDLVLYGDYWWHTWDLFPQPDPGKLAFRLGAGPRVGFNRHDEFGLRFMAGVDFWPHKHPLEFFVEAGPVFILASDTHFHMDAGIGVRLYFAQAKGK